jgi:hypothetical protein
LAGISKHGPTSQQEPPADLTERPTSSNCSTASAKMLPTQSLVAHQAFCHTCAECHGTKGDPGPVNAAPFVVCCRVLAWLTPSDLASRTSATLWTGLTSWLMVSRSGGAETTCAAGRPPQCSQSFESRNLYLVVCVVSLRQIFGAAHIWATRCWQLVITQLTSAGRVRACRHDVCLGWRWHLDDVGNLHGGGSFQRLNFQDQNQ